MKYFVDTEANTITVLPMGIRKGKALAAVAGRTRPFRLPKPRGRGRPCKWEREFRKALRV